MQLQTKKTKTRTGGDANPKGKVAKTPTNPKNVGVAEPFTNAQRKNYVRCEHRFLSRVRYRGSRVKGGKKVRKVNILSYTTLIAQFVPSVLCRLALVM